MSRNAAVSERKQTQKATASAIPFPWDVHHRWLRGDRAKTGDQTGQEEVSRFPPGSGTFGTRKVHSTKLLSLSIFYIMSISFLFFFFKG